MDVLLKRLFISCKFWLSVSNMEKYFQALLSITLSKFYEKNLSIAHFKGLDMRNLQYEIRKIIMKSQRQFIFSTKWRASDFTIFGHLDQRRRKVWKSGGGGAVIEGHLLEHVSPLPKSEEAKSPHNPLVPPALLNCMLLSLQQQDC